MIPKHRIPTHPGEMLLEEFLKPLGISQTELAEHLGVHAPKISAIVNGRQGVTPAMAWKLSKALGTSPEIWLDLQAGYDLARAREDAPPIRRMRKAS